MLDSYWSRYSSWVFDTYIPDGFTLGFTHRTCPPPNTQPPMVQNIACKRLYVYIIIYIINFDVGSKRKRNKSKTRIKRMAVSGIWDFETTNLEKIYVKHHFVHFGFDFTILQET